jgi:arginase
MYDIDKKGIGKVMEEVQDYMAGRNIHLSYDIDSMDPFYAPSTGTAVRGGLTFREVCFLHDHALLPLLTPPLQGNYICETLYETGNLTSMEMVEVNPMLTSHHSDAKKTAEMAITLIRAAMGRTIL